jgi:hypothetical protein
MTILTFLQQLFSYAAVALLAFVLGVMLCPSVQNLIATLTGLTARLAARCGPGATTSAGASGVASGHSPATSAGANTAAAPAKPA